LLASDSGASSFLLRDVGIAASRALGDITVQQMIGKTISHYRIEEKLGEGGMGTVYRARDLNLNRSVAVKFISSELGDAEHRRRFQLEAESASSLNHPNILSVYEAGSVDGQQYLVTEFIDGFTLREWVRRKKPSVRQIVDVCAGIADGLACAHQSGILHRDIKPENILVSKQGYAKLVDFGAWLSCSRRRREQSLQTWSRGEREPERF